MNPNLHFDEVPPDDPAPDKRRSATSEFLRAQGEAPQRTPIQKIFGRSPLTVHSRSWLWAALGEVEVARALARLADGWKVVHSVPIRDAESQSCVDHLVIGPGGVYAVRAASFSGQDVWVSERSLIVAGHRLPHLRQVTLAVGQAETALSAAVDFPVSVIGVIAVVEPESITVTGRPRDVDVVASSQLTRWISRRPVILGPLQIRMMVDAATTESTWQAHPFSSPESVALVESFESIRRELVAARMVRRMWAAGGAVALAGGAVSLAIAIIMGN
ncbi:nuclease-related domain-containing protein [Homoserinimonas hongtaonis]|nr:nuclease-related domain-containing protein [Salinibacterium hongtaonis]